MKGRVLVIDDEAGIRQEIASGLAAQGYDVACCADGLSAIRLLFGDRKKVEPFTHIVADMFLPDIDGLKIIEAARIRQPDMPALLLSDIVGGTRKKVVGSKPDTAFLEKPFGFSEFMKAFGELSPGSAEAGLTVEAAASVTEPEAAYLAIRVEERERRLELLNDIRKMEGVKRCDAVRGGFDIVVAAQGFARDQIERLKERISSLKGVEIVFVHDVSRPEFDRELKEFISVYSREVKTRDAKMERKLSGRTCCIFADIDKNELERIFVTVFSNDEVLFCDATNEGWGLAAWLETGEAVGVTPRIIEKLGRIDGVLRVREAEVIRLED